MSKTTDISEYQLSESLCSSPNSTPTSKRHNNPLNIDSRDPSNIFTHSPPLSHVSKGIKGTPTLLLEEHGMFPANALPCDPWHFTLLKACSKLNDILYLCSTDSASELEQNQQTSQKHCQDQRLSQTTVLSSKEKLQLFWIVHEVWGILATWVPWFWRTEVPFLPGFCGFTLPIDHICYLFSVLIGLVQPNMKIIP